MLGPLYSGAAVGANGVATANQDSSGVVSGRILAIGLGYLDTPPATTDVVLATKGTSGPVQTFFTRSDSGTDGWFYPRVATVSTAGVALLYAGGGTAVSDYLAIHDVVNVKIDQANAGDGVQVWLLME